MVYLSIVDDLAVVYLALEPRWVHYFDSGFYRERLPKNSYILARLVEFQPLAIQLEIAVSVFDIAEDDDRHIPPDDP